MLHGFARSFVAASRVSGLAQTSRYFRALIGPQACFALLDKDEPGTSQFDFQARSTKSGGYPVMTGTPAAAFLKNAPSASGGRMQITISVTAQDYECLLNHVSAESSVDHTLRTAAIIHHSGADAIYQSYEIICDETQAQELRTMAQQHCPDVAPKIEYAIRNAMPDRA